MNDIIVIFLQNYVPRGIIPHNFINKINAYNKNQNKDQLINKITNDLFIKVKDLNKYIIHYNNELMNISHNSIKELITQLINDNCDQQIIISHKDGSAFGRYYLYFYMTSIN